MRWFRRKKEVVDSDWLPAGPGVAAFLIWHGLRRVSYSTYCDTQLHLGAKTVTEKEFWKLWKLYRELYEQSNIVSQVTDCKSTEFPEFPSDREAVLDWIGNQWKLDGNCPSFTETRNQFPGVSKGTISKWRRLAIAEFEEGRRMDKAA